MTDNTKLSSESLMSKFDFDPSNWDGEAREQALVILDELAHDVKEKVLDIETGPDIHQNHYGEYLALLGNFKGEYNIKLMAIAVVKAGKLINIDNQTGVKLALKVMGY